MMLRSVCGVAAALTLVAAPASDGGRRWWSYVKYLADDKLEGRNTGSEGYRKAAAYVAGEFERAGLRAAGTDGYLQAVKFRARRIEEKGCSLELMRKGAVEALTLGEDAHHQYAHRPGALGGGGPGVRRLWTGRPGSAF